MTLSVYTDPHRLNDVCTVSSLLMSPPTSIDKRGGIHPHRLDDVCTIVVILLPLTKEVVYICIVC